jgi:hypothetical protein
VKILKFRRTELLCTQNKQRGEKKCLLGIDTCPIVWMIRQGKKSFPEGCNTKSGTVFRYCKTNIFSCYSIIFLTLLSSLCCYYHLFVVTIIIRWRYYHHQMTLLLSSDDYCFYGQKIDVAKTATTIVTQMNDDSNIIWWW